MGARCRRCGRPLRDPASIALGLGRICRLRALAAIPEEGEPEAERDHAGQEPKAEEAPAEGRRRQR